MTQLNLPDFEYRIKKTEGKVFIFDEIRRKYVVLTPEEWVRQHFIHFMITRLAYPKALMRVESGLVFNKLSKRSDIVVHTRTGDPWMLVECKATDQPISMKSLQQVSVYNNSLRAPYIAMTNGLVHFVCAVDWMANSTTPLSDFPAYN